MMFDENGTSVVEVAILLPLFTALLLGSIWAGDVSVARLKQQQALRYLTWEATAFALSDEDGADHAGRFQQARGQVLAEAGRRWERLQGDEREVGPLGMLAEVRLGEVDWEPDAIAVGGKLKGLEGGRGLSAVVATVSELIGKFAGLQDPVLRHAGFNLDHAAVRTSVAAEISSRLLPLPAGWAEERLQLSPLSSLLEVDAWALDDGSDVPLPGMGTAFGKQVERIALLGVGEKLRSGKAGAVLDWFPVQFGAQVVSQNYRAPEDDSSKFTCFGDALADTGRWRNGKEAGTPEDTISPTKCFDTLPMDANGFGPGGGLGSDPMYRLLRSRGNHFMGCDRPESRYPAGCGSGGGTWQASR